MQVAIVGLDYPRHNTQNNINAFMGMYTYIYLDMHVSLICLFLFDKLAS